MTVDEMEAYADRVRDDLDKHVIENQKLRSTNEKLVELVERLKSEAEIHAQEARTQRATVHEIYQLVTGSKGEPGNWNGAEPVRKLAEQNAKLEAFVRSISYAVFGSRNELRISREREGFRIMDTITTQYRSTGKDVVEALHNLWALDTPEPLDTEETK